MAKTPQYNEQYRYKGNVAPSYYQNVDQRGILSAYQQNQSSAQFGAIGKALGQAGQALGQYVNYRQNANVDESINNLQNAFTEWQTEQSKLQGKDAMDSEQDYETWRQKKISEITQNLNEVEKGRFNQKSQNMLASQGAWANKYGYQNEQSYLDDTHKASIATSCEGMARNRNDPNFMASEIQRLQGLTAEYSIRKGMSEESSRSYYRETLTNGMVGVTKTMINENELGNAQKVLDKYKGEMEQETYSALSAQIKTKREALYKKAQAEQAEREARVLEANINEQASSILSVVASAPTVAEREQMAVKYYAEIKDPKVRRAVSSLVSEEFKYQETLEKSKVYDAVQAFSEEASDMSPREQADWKFEKGYQGAELNAINEIIYNQNTKENEENIRQQQEGFVFVDSLFQNASNAKEENVKAYIAETKMTAKQGQELLDYYNNGGSIGGITQTNINNAYKYATGETNVKNMPVELSDFIRKNAPIGREPTQFEINQLAGLYYMKGDSESKWWGTSETYAEAEKNGSEKEWLPTITDDEKVIIQAQLENANIYPTDKNMQIYKRRAMLDLKGDNYDYQGVSEGNSTRESSVSNTTPNNINLLESYDIYPQSTGIDTSYTPQAPKQKTIQSELDKDFEKHTPFSFGNSHLTEAGKKYYIVERQLQVLKGKSFSDEQKQEAIAVLEKYDAVNAPYLQDEMIEEIKDALARYGNE